MPSDPAIAAAAAVMAGVPEGVELISSGPFAGLPLHYAGAVAMDPPWLDITWSAKGRGKSVDRHYQPQTLEWIKTLPVASLCKSDCSLTLWHTQAMGDQAREVMGELGFRFKTEGAWAKRSRTDRCWQFGTGRILRSAAEFYIVGTRGHPRVQSRSVRNLIVAPVRGHSRKPDEMYEDIEQLWLGPYIELFATHRRVGWIQWGAGLRPDSADANAQEEAA